MKFSLIPSPKPTRSLFFESLVQKLPYGCVYIYLTVEPGSFIKDANYRLCGQLISTDVKRDEL